MVEFLRLEKVRSQNFHRKVQTQKNVYIKGIKEILAFATVEKEQTLDRASSVICHRYTLTVEIGFTQITDFSHSICSFVKAPNVQPESLDYPHDNDRCEALETRETAMSLWKESLYGAFSCMVVRVCRYAFRHETQKYWL
jgi:hypothetical protein